MEEKLVKKFELENGQTLIISDCSRMISEDAWIVKIKARMDVPVKKNLFLREDQKDIVFEDIVDKVGKAAVYEYEAERNFVMEKDKNKIFEKLLNDFSGTIVKYISKPEFPGKLVLKKYKDKVDNNQYTIKAV